MQEGKNMNKLYFGDNLEIMKDLLKKHPDGFIDLIYIDPPFNSKRNYNILFENIDMEDTKAQKLAFADTWSNVSYLDTIEEIKEIDMNLANFLSALDNINISKSAISYLATMSIRIWYMHKLLKKTGSFYLHCDPTMSHYLKIVCDLIFGEKNFRNEIIWKRTTAHNDPKRFGRIHDILLFYSKSDKPTWNPVFASYDTEYVDTYYRYTDEAGRKFLSDNLTAPSHGSDSGQYEWRGKYPPQGRMWSYTKENMERLEAEGRIFYTKNRYPRFKRYLEDMPGMPAQSIWTDVINIRSWHKEDLGYETQKPLTLLERIIKASSNERDVVLDPFCGCGTALVAAQKLNRRWIGIDITHLAINLMRNRLKDSFGIRSEVIGEPVDLAGAKALAHQDRYQFQWWALGLIGARPLGEKKKGADKGIDGIIQFHEYSNVFPACHVLQSIQVRFQK